jgi:hypothetical protein
METPHHKMSHLFKGPGAVVNDLTGVKYALVSVFYLQLKLNTLGILNVPADKNLKD